MLKGSELGLNMCLAADKIAHSKHSHEKEIYNSALARIIIIYDLFHFLMDTRKYLSIYTALLM